MKRLDWKSLSLVLLPKLIGGVSVFALNLLIVRFVEPASFGVISFCAMAMVLFDGLIASAIDLAVLRLAPESGPIGPSPTAIERVALFVKLVLGAALLLAAAGFGGLLSAHILNGSADPLVFLAVAGAAASTMLLRASQSYCQLRGALPVFGALDLSTTVARCLGVIALLLSGTATPISVMVCYAGAPLLPFTVWAVLTRNRLLSPSTPLRFNETLQAMWAVLRTMLATTLVGAVAARLDILLLSVYSTPANVGLYSAAATIATVPDLFGSYLSSALTPQIVPRAQSGSFLAFFKETQFRLYGLALLMLAIGWTAGGFLLRMLLPAKYAGSIDLVYLLLPAAAAGLVTFPLTLNFLMFYSPRTFLWLDLLTAPLLIWAYRSAAIGEGARTVALVTCFAKVGKAAVVHGVAWRKARQMQQLEVPADRVATAKLEKITVIEERV